MKTIENLIGELEGISPQQLMEKYYSLFYTSPKYKQYFASYLVYCSLDLEEDYTLADKLDDKMLNISKNLIEQLFENFYGEDTLLEFEYEEEEELKNAFVDKLLDGFGVISEEELCCELRGSCFDKFGPIRKVVEEVMA